MRKTNICTGLARHFASHLEDLRNRARYTEDLTMSTPNGVLSPPQRSESAGSHASLGKRKRAESEEGLDIRGISDMKTRTKGDERVQLLELLKDTVVIMRR